MTDAGSVEPHMLSTSIELPGFRIRQSHGVVHGVAMSAHGIASVAGLSGLQLAQWSALCEEMQGEASSRLRQHAHAAGANAVVSVRYDVNEPLPRVTRVTAHGTAVSATPSIDRESDGL